MDSIKKSLKEKRLKKLKLLKMQSKHYRRDNEEEQEDEEETGEQLMQLAAESKTKIGKAKIVIKEDGEDSEKEEIAGMDEEPLQEEQTEHLSLKQSSKKKKRSEKTVEEVQPHITEEDSEDLHFEEITHTVIKRPYNSFTLTIGFPDSVIQKCQVDSPHQSFELRNFMLSQLARIASIHMVDEIVIVKDHSFSHRNKEFSSIGSLTKILQYLETPQYLRKSLFPISSDLKYVGSMLLSRTDEPDREQPPSQD